MRTLFVLALALIATPALAHHPMAGATPATVWHGLLSGIGHPIIGLDHLAFVIAIGLVSAFLRSRLLLPATFALATVAGCGLFLAGVTLPLMEVAITASVVALGAVVMLGRRVSVGVLAALIAVAGLFHGGAYADAIVGAETTPLVAYLAGFAVTQAGIALAVAWGVGAVLRAAEPTALHPRLAGAVVAGIGVAFLVETVEGMIFV